MIEPRKPADGSDGQRAGPGGRPVILLSRSFPAQADQVAEARTRTATALANYPGFDGDIAVQLVSELASNAVCHSRSERITLVITLTTAGLVRVAVADSGNGPTKPKMRKSGVTEEGGRGLWLVNVLAPRWGVTKRKDGGYTVWFELPSQDEETAFAGMGSHDD